MDTSAHVTDTKGAIEKVRERRAGGGGRHYHGPIEKGMKASGLDLGGKRDYEKSDEDRGADKIAEPKCHRDRIASRLAEGGGGDFDNPETQRDFGNFTESVFPIHGVRSWSFKMSAEGRRTKRTDQ